MGEVPAFSVPPARAGTDRVWFGQPSGLTILFLTEAWEKFSYYGMRTILIYYMTKQLLFPQTKASLVYGIYTGMAYFTPLIGGFISDRWLGRRRAVIIGGITMAIGHFMMAWPNLIFPALATIAAGNGLYVPNLPAQVAPLYAHDDPRGKSAMNIYYLGINFGAFIAPLIVGTLGELCGWEYGFAAAGVGMLVGLSIYLLGQKRLAPDPIRAANFRPLGYKLPRSRLNRQDWRRVGLLLGIVGAMVVFRAAYEQVGDTFPLWADGGVDRRVGGGFTIPMTWFISLNALLVLVLTLPLVRWWTRRAARGRRSETMTKMAFGAALMGGSFFFLSAVSAIGGAGHQVSWLWFVIFFFIYTTAELHILPVGLGLFSRMAPAGIAATAIAIWFANAFLGNFAAGLLGQLWTYMSPAPFFAVVGGVCLVPTTMLMVFNKPVLRAESESDRFRAETAQFLAAGLEVAT